MTNTTQSNVNNKYIKFSHENKSILFSISDEMYDDFYDEFKKSQISFYDFMNEDEHDFIYYVFQKNCDEILMFHTYISCIYEYLFEDYYDENKHEIYDKNIQQIVVSCVQLS